jgi:hypothetical protein
MFEKPLRGAYDAERKRKKREHKGRESDVMSGVRREDGNRCRVPRCGHRDLTVDVMHRQHRGMGGNPAEDRTVPEGLMCGCRIHHSAYDRGRLEIHELTDLGWRGACEYYMDGVFIGRETTARVSVTREAV